MANQFTQKHNKHIIKNKICSHINLMMKVKGIGSVVEMTQQNVSSKTVK